MAARHRPDPVRAAPKLAPCRLDFLDWLRLLMVVAVVYAHTALSGLTVGGGLDAQWLIDDRTLYYDAYNLPSHHLHAGAENMHLAGPAPRSVRWISIMRQWCLPLLFWVSGAAIACSYKGGAPRGLPKLLLFSAIGMLMNAGLWFLSPQSPECVVDMAECEGKGILFDFSICGRAGVVFAVMFQMWYTLILFALTLFSWPIFAVLHGSASSAVLVVQWGLSTGFVSVLLFLGSVCANRVRAILCYGLVEAAFLGVVALDASRQLPVPKRLLHYSMGGLLILQFCTVPFAEEMKHVEPECICFMFAGFSKFFCMGYVMTHDRRGGPGGDDGVQPLLSAAWPLVLFLLTAVAPSTNWDVAGMLTYPYFFFVVDRCLYVAGALVVVFVLDRVSRSLHCMPMPAVFGRASLFLYVAHPWLITAFLAVGLRSVMQIWLLTVATVLAVIYPVEFARRSWAERQQLPKMPLDWDNMSPRTSFCGTPHAQLLSDDSDSGARESCSESESVKAAVR